MKREILVNATPRETRVAILEDGQLVELLVDRPDARRMVGDVYLGKVEAVLPGIQAAFVNIGTEKSAFLHAADVVVELSPFTVNSAADKGYRAENTLAGSRLNTSLRDTPASISVFTREFLDDIGLNEIPRRERRGDAARADPGG